MVCIFELQELNSTKSVDNNIDHENKIIKKTYKNLQKKTKKIQYCGCPYTGFINKSRLTNK